jgi:hypothetical protein
MAGLSSIILGITLLGLELIRRGLWYLPYIVLFIGVTLISWHYIEQWHKKNKLPQFPCTFTEGKSNDAKNNQTKNKCNANKRHESHPDQKNPKQGNGKANCAVSLPHNTPPRGKS